MTHSTHAPYDVILLGAGASGLLCALTAAKRQKKVLLVDHNSHAGKKISISGGGKANFTNGHMSTDFFFGQDVSFAEPALEAFTPTMLLDFFAKHGLAWEERAHGQLFGLDSAKYFVQALVEECRRYGCEFLLEHSIDSVEYTDGVYVVQAQGKCAQNTYVQGKSLVLALGSPAWGQIGATDLGLSLAKKFGHKVQSFSPVLTSLQMPAQWPLAGLSGISLPVTVRVQRRDGKGVFAHSEALLFTHTGISGPAVLQASCHWQEGQALHIDFLPHMRLEEILDAPECGKLFVRTLVARHMPQRLADALLPEAWAKRKIAELSRKVRQELHACVHDYAIVPQKRGPMAKAEAAYGGVLVQDSNAWSMESLLQERLFIVGELLDITGQLGGYNLHWAFASGYLAGQNI